jgi:hypothetical protein
MRRFLLSLLASAAVLVLVAPLVGCAGTCGTLPTAVVQAPSIAIPPPLSFRQDPQIVPTGYAQVVQVPVQQQYAPVQQYATPMAAPCAPCAVPNAAPVYSHGYDYAPPPVPAQRCAP